ncbi:hypothetical protein JCM10908_004650 [Rhodotorula pacifica]|uniref:uncharacterized protein n=1 Tax=Rhodotorula pacifica TaxID=1495444 RepID=UPI00317BE2B4
MATTVAESVKARRDRRQPKYAATIPTPSSRSAHAPKPSSAHKTTQKKRVVASSTATSPSGKPRGKKTVTARQKASDRSFASVGDSLRCKALSAVLKATVTSRKQQKGKAKGKGKARTGIEDEADAGGVTHPAIRSYVDEHLEGMKLSRRDLTTRLKEAKDSLVEEGFTVSSKKCVHLADDIELDLSQLRNDKDFERAAADLLSEHSPATSALKKSPSKTSSYQATRSRARLKAAAVSDEMSDGEGEELQEDGSDFADGLDEQAEASGDYYEPGPSKKQSRLSKTSPPKGKTPPKKRAKRSEPKSSDARQPRKKPTSDGDHKEASVEQDDAAVQDAGDDANQAQNSGEAERQLNELSEANKFWRAKAILLRQRLEKHEDLGDLDFDVQEALGEDASDTLPEQLASYPRILPAEDDAKGADEQLFDAFVDAGALASGSGGRNNTAREGSPGFAAPDFPQLDFVPDAASSPLSTDKGKQKAIFPQSSSPLPLGSSQVSFRPAASSSSPTKSRGDSPASPFAGFDRASSEPSSPFPLPNRPDLQHLPIHSATDRRAREDQELQSASLKNEIELLTRRYHERVSELTTVKFEMSARLAASETARTALQHSLDKASDEHELQMLERLKEHDDALRDVVDRARSLEAEIAEYKKREEQYELELESSKAEYEGVLAQEHRAREAERTASERVVALENALQERDDDLVAARSATLDNLEVARKCTASLETELEKARRDIAALKTSRGECEAELDRSTKELEHSTKELGALRAKCAQLQKEKEHETEALDISMEQRREVELKWKKELQWKQDELMRVTERYDRAARADQATIKELTGNLSQLGAVLEEVEQLRKMAESAADQQKVADDLRKEMLEWQEKFEDAEAARAEQEGNAAAQDCQMRELRTRCDRLNHDLLNFESEASRASAQVDRLLDERQSLEREHALLVVELQQAIGTLGGGVALGDPRSLLHSLQQRLQDDAAQAEQLALAHRDLLNSATSCARDIVALLPGGDAAAHDLSLNEALAATLRGVCDLHAANAQAVAEREAALFQVSAQRDAMLSMQRSLIGWLGEKDDVGANGNAPDSAALAQETMQLVDLVVEILMQYKERNVDLATKLQQSSAENEERRIELVERQRNIDELTTSFNEERAARQALQDRLQQIHALSESSVAATPQAGAAATNDKTMHAPGTNGKNRCGTGEHA